MGLFSIVTLIKIFSKFFLKKQRIWMENFFKNFINKHQDKKWKIRKIMRVPGGSAHGRGPGGETPGGCSRLLPGLKDGVLYNFRVQGRSPWRVQQAAARDGTESNQILRTKSSATSSRFLVILKVLELLKLTYGYRFIW